MAEAMRAGQIKEIKLFPDGRRAEFDCQLLYGDRRLVVLRYVSSRPYLVEEVELPPGSVTTGFYWRWRPYLLWRMSSPQGQTLAYRFDVCTGVRFGPDWVEWKDLILDLWLPASGSPRFLDEAEVIAYQKQLNSEELATIQRTKPFLWRNQWRLVAEAEAFLRTLESSHDSD